MLLVPAGDQELRESPASGGPGEQGLARQRRPVAGSRGRVGCRDARPGGPCQERAAVCEGKTFRLVLCKLSTERPEEQGWCIERSREEFSVYLQFIFLMGGWETKLVATAMRGVTPALPLCSLFTTSQLSMEGCGWQARLSSELHHLHVYLPGSLSVSLSPPWGPLVLCGFPPHCEPYWGLGGTERGASSENAGRAKDEKGNVFYQAGSACLITSQHHGRPGEAWALPMSG